MAALFAYRQFLIERLRERERRNRVRLHNRLLRDASDPFTLPEDTFKKLYRLNKENTRYVLDSLVGHLRHSARSDGTPAILKVFATLQFFATGSYQKQIGLAYNVGLSQPAFSKALKECLQVIIEVLMPQWLQFPTDRSLNAVKQRFMEKFNIPGDIGCVDGTHIAIVSPQHNHPTQPAIAFFNRKGYYSINAQIICDADLKITALNARYPGSSHDSAVWQLSGIKRYLEELHPVNPQGWLLGDSGYPLQPWLLTPVTQAQTNGEISYNSAHTTARNTVERCIGVLKSRFRCLLKHRTLHYHPETAGKIILCCAVMHNICIGRNDNWEDIIDILDEMDNGDGTAHDQADGRIARNNLIRNHFT